MSCSLRGSMTLRRVTIGQSCNRLPFPNHSPVSLGGFQIGFIFKTLTAPRAMKWRSILIMDAPFNECPVTQHCSCHRVVAVDLASDWLNRDDSRIFPLFFSRDSYIRWSNRKLTPTNVSSLLRCVRFHSFSQTVDEKSAEAIGRRLPECSQLSSFPHSTTSIALPLSDN